MGEGDSITINCRSNQLCCCVMQSTFTPSPPLHPSPPLPAHLPLAGTVPVIGSTTSSCAVLSEDRLDSTKLKWYVVRSLLMRYTVSLA